MSFVYGTVVETLYTLETPVTKNTYTAQEIISAGSGAPRCIIPANFFSYLGTSKGLLVRGFGTIGATSGTNAFTCNLLWDPTPGSIGTSLATMFPSTTITASVTAAGFNFEALITCQGIGNANLILQVDGKMEVGVVANGTVSTAPQANYFTANITGLNSEAQAAIELAGTWGANNAANTTTLKQFNVYGVN